MTGHRQKGDAEPLQPLFSCREQAGGSNARGHSGPTRPRQGSASPPEGVGLSLDVCAGTQLPPPAPGLPSGDPGRPCEAPRRCLQATVFEPHPVLVMLCPPLPPPQKLENIEFLFYFCLRMLSHLGAGGWCESRGVCKGSWAALVARCSLSSSVGGGLEPWAVQVPGCIRICEQQGCQLPAVSQGTAGQVSVIRFL